MSFKNFYLLIREREGGREREEGINLLFHLFMNLSVASYMCPGRDGTHNPDIAEQCYSQLSYLPSTIAWFLCTSDSSGFLGCHWDSPSLLPQDLRVLGAFPWILSSPQVPWSRGSWCTVYRHLVDDKTLWGRTQEVKAIFTTIRYYLPFPLCQYLCRWEKWPVFLCKSS